MCDLTLGTCECVDSIPYAHRHYDQGNIVCVCNATYCDNFPEISSRASSRVDVYESNKAGLRFSKTTLNANAGFRRHVQDMDGDTTPPTVRIVVDRNTSYQDILGFGGAFTDAAGINIYALQSNLSKLVIDNYYSSNGLEYTIGRIPIGGSDFSTRKYTYDDHENDFNLANFSLADEDIHYKVGHYVNLFNLNKLHFFSSSLLLFSTSYFLSKVNVTSQMLFLLFSIIDSQTHTTWWCVCCICVYIENDFHFSHRYH